MSCASKVFDHIESIPLGQPFTTRDCLRYGSRGAVDKALFRFVRDNVIVRLADGVFMRMDADTPIPSITDVAKIKSAAFAKEIVEYGATIAHKEALEVEAPEQPTFYINGSSTTFRYVYIGIRIILKSASKKRMRLKETPQGKIVRALWHLGKKICTQKIVDQVLERYPIPDIREILALSKAWMPAWLADYFPTPHVFSLEDAYSRDILYDSNFAPISSA